MFPGFIADFDAVDRVGTCQAGDLHTYLRSSTLVVLAATESAPENKVLHVVMKSKHATQLFMKRMAAHENRRWLDLRPEASAMWAAVAALQRRSAKTTFTFIDKTAQKEWEEIKHWEQ
ncbi:hypothetical protein AURDEDRAFT_174529, partial [Auricularia subglabra TFB-10046 SS5]